MRVRDRWITKLLEGKLLSNDGLDLSPIADRATHGNRKSEAYAVWALLWETARRYNQTYRSDPTGVWVFENTPANHAEVEVFVQQVLREWSGDPLKWLPIVKIPKYTAAPPRAGAIDDRHKGLLPWLNKQGYARAQIVYKGLHYHLSLAGDSSDIAWNWPEGRIQWAKGHVGPLFRGWRRLRPIVIGPTSPAPPPIDYGGPDKSIPGASEPHEPFDEDAFYNEYKLMRQQAFVRYLVKPLAKVISAKPHQRSSRTVDKPSDNVPPPVSSPTPSARHGPTASAIGVPDSKPPECDDTHRQPVDPVVDGRASPIHGDVFVSGAITPQGRSLTPERSIPGSLQPSKTVRFQLPHNG